VALPDIPNLSILGEVSIDMVAELGGIWMVMEDLTALRAGAILSLDSHAEQPIKLLANGRPFAHGEVVVVDEKFAVRLVSLAPPQNESGTNAA
jgi:flagellar motor switch protein FliN/FliY